MEIISGIFIGGVDRWQTNVPGAISFTVGKMIIP